MTTEEDKKNCYPETFNVRNIESCKLWSYRFSRRDDAYLDRKSIDKKSYRIKEDMIGRILCGEIIEPYVVYKYGRYHLENIPKQIKLSRNKIICSYCNGHGMLNQRFCPKCNGSRTVKKVND